MSALLVARTKCINLVDSGSKFTLVKKSVVDGLSIKGFTSPYAENTMKGNPMMYKLSVLTDNRSERIYVDSLFDARMLIK